MQPPIADPNATPLDHFAGDDVREFRIRFWPYFLGGWIGGVIGVAIGVILLAILRRFFSLNWPPPSGEIILKAAGIVTVVAAVICVYIWRFWPLQVGRWGVRGVNFWTVRSQASWEQMSSVKFVWLFFSYAVVSCEGQPKLWVWLSLKNTREFARAVAEFTPSDHPLQQFLRRRGLLP